MISDGRAKNKVIVALLLLFGIGIFLCADNIYEKICAIICLIFAVFLFVCKAKRMNVLLASILMFLCIDVTYIGAKAEEILYIYDTTFNVVNAQSFWYNNPNPLHRDVLIHTLLREKTAVVPDSSCWYYRFVDVFSEKTECDNTVGDIIEESDGVDFYNVGVMRMRSLQDLLDEEVYNTLDKNLNENHYQYLFVAVEGFEKAEKILVLSDDDYNLYLMPFE